MLRSISLAVLAAGTLALSACGSDAPSGVSPQTAKASIEKAAHVKLATTPVPDDARKQGLRAAYTNAPTAAKDKQVVGVFVMKDAGVADKVSDMVRGSAPKSARLIVDGEVMVVYAAAGTDRADAVERAVKSL